MRAKSIVALCALGLLTVAALSNAETSSGSASDKSAAPTQVQAQPAPSTEGATQKEPGATEGTMHKTAPSHAPKLDLNRATKEELMKLPGVTEATAGKIIAARPFKNTSELTSKKILNKAEYQKVSGMVMVKTDQAAHKKHY